MLRLFAVLFLSLLFHSCAQKQEQKMTPEPAVRVFPNLDENRYNVAFLIMDGVYNTEFTAPYDIFQHTQYRKNIKAMNTFTVANTPRPYYFF